jgi:hypothetical protein
MCAIGCLIPENRYHHDMEGIEANDSRIMRAAGVDPHDPTMASFLDRLQDIHDVSCVEKWAEELRKLAHDEVLDASVLDRSAKP